MSAVPVPESAARRRIGDILLELGFATEQQLAEATTEQERTGQPLGQILVDFGAITRLELASALAEQWSDESNSISLLPMPKPSRRAVQPHDDDDQYAARLQDAVADLARRVDATAPSEDAEDGRVTELAERVEATVARAQRLEATVATLAESLEGVTGGVEEVLTGLQSGIAGLAIDLARVDSTVAEMVARPAEIPAPDAALLERLTQLEASVQELTERPPADAGARARLEEIAGQLAHFADGEALQTVRETLAEIESRVADNGATSAVSDELDAQRATLVQLQAAVAELGARPQHGSELDEKLARFEARLDETSSSLASAASADLVARLAAQLDTAADVQQSLAVSVDDLHERVKEPGRLVAEINERLDTLAREQEVYATLAQRLDALEITVSTTEPDPRIDTFGAELARLAESVASLHGEHEERVALAARVAALEIPTAAPPPDPRIEELAGELTSLRHDLTQRVAAAASEVDPALGQEIARLAEQVEQVVRAAKEQPELAVELASLEDRLQARTVTPEAVAEAVERIREELRPADPGPDPRIDALAADVTAWRDELSRRAEATAPAPDPELAATLSGLLSRISAVETRLTSEVASPAALTHAIDELRAELAGAAAPPPPDMSGFDAAITTLTERVADLEAISERVDRLTDSLEHGVDAANTGVLEDLRQEVEAQLAPLVTGLEEALRHEVESMVREIATEQDPVGVAAAAAPAGFEDDMERTRMAIERLSLHIGEHDRALAEMMRGRSLQQRVDDLAARIDEISAGGGGAVAAGPADGSASARRADADASDIHSLVRRIEGLEEDTLEARERLMNRLERMASSIDWRLQRLETGAPE